MPKAYVKPYRQMRASVNPELVSFLVVPVFEAFDLGGKPGEILAEVRPEECVSRAWIPQTLGEQVWVLYEFPDLQTKAAWEATLPPTIAKWIHPEHFDYAKKYLKP